MKTKECKLCHEIESLDLFHKNPQIKTYRYLLRVSFEDSSMMEIPLKTKIELKKWIDNSVAKAILVDLITKKEVEVKI